MPNVELLEKTLQFIKDHPEQHDQANWCGTYQCFAGWAAHFAGWQQKHSQSTLVVRDGHVLDVSDAAAEGLGVTDHDAGQLFDGYNGIGALEHMVKDLVNGVPLMTSEEYQDKYDR